MEIPDLYANSIFVAARGVGRRAAQRRPCSKEALRKCKSSARDIHVEEMQLTICVDLF